jgi:hypothetical protein
LINLHLPNWIQQIVEHFEVLPLKAGWPILGKNDDIFEDEIDARLTYSDPMYDRRRPHSGKQSYPVQHPACKSIGSTMDK